MQGRGNRNLPTTTTSNPAFQHDHIGALDSDDDDDYENAGDVVIPARGGKQHAKQPAM